MEENLDITLRPVKISFTASCIKIADLNCGKYRVPYKGIVLACLCVCDGESDVGYEPEITDITGDMDGELILYDAGRRRIRIKTDLAGKTAGAFFLELAIRAPYILLGGQPWLCMEEKADYAQAGEMVRVMRQECW